MTWKKCICCSKAGETVDDNVTHIIRLPELCTQYDTLQQTEGVTPNQSAEAVNNETPVCLTGNERNERQDLNHQKDNTSVNDQNYYRCETEFNESSHAREGRKRCDERDSVDLSGHVGKVRCVHDERLHSRHLDTFLDHLCYEIKLKVSDKVVDSIKTAVESLVIYLLNKLGQYEPTLTSSELVRTGSCYDGTKILQPDEFDFLAVIDCLSLNDLTIAEASSVTCSAGGYAHAVCKERSPDWSRTIEQGDDNCVIACLKSRSLRTIFRNRFHFILLNELDNAFSVETPTGVLNLMGFSVPLNGPQCNVKVLWTSKDSLTSQAIDIDISPAIKCRLKNELTTSEVVNEDVFKVMSKEQYVYLIPRPKRTCNKCLKMVFPRSDQQMVMELSESHRKVLLILKYLSHEVRNFNFLLKTVFNSFTMKNVLLHHALRCKEIHCQDIDTCLMMTLRYMKHKLDRQSPELTCIYTVSRNLWKNAEEKEITQARGILRNLVELFNKINGEKFKDCNFDQLKFELLLACSNTVPLTDFSNCAPEKEC